MQTTTADGVRVEVMQADITRLAVDTIAVQAVLDTLPRVPVARRVVFACFGAETKRAIESAVAQRLTRGGRD